jgi:antitoxin CptB
MSATDVGADQAVAKALAERRARLWFRSHHRGMKELDVLVGRFAERYLAELAPAALDAYEALLAEPDIELWDWVMGRATPPPERMTPILALFLGHGRPETDR